MLPISIIVPCYNAAATLARTLESCLIQPEAAQIIVVDDGSADDSMAIVRQYGERDARVGLLPMPVNGGAARARNWGALHADQPLLAFIDADDEYFPAALAAASLYLEQHPAEAAIRLDVEFSGFPADITTHSAFDSLGATLSNTVPSSLVIRRAAFAALGGFPMDAFFRRNGGEDGAFSWALRELFGNQRLVDSKRVRMHYHARIHAERYFRIFMGMQQARPEDVAESFRLSEVFVEAAKANLAQLRALSAPAPEAATTHPT
ncbi:glycosyltransferase family A protein [Paraburkholderia sp. DHOC27]|uniref:glycosyltransferase family 2 protein n=1 Tax=Paraburkholderia sp. DHOC27 TaxID=2303330 RepID=UPI000E3D5948|nr:glycosyltransferase family A protein [Paraburkholderia sp. DHOC27]RFU43705.1 glycosyltransferase family 2 protein [Paraburkholderia sp. DHOC27]